MLFLTYLIHLNSFSLQFKNNSRPIYNGIGFPGVKEIMDKAEEAEKDEIIREVERRHKEKLDEVRVTVRLNLLCVDFSLRSYYLMTCTSHLQYVQEKKWEKYHCIKKFLEMFGIYFAF